MAFARLKRIEALIRSLYATEADLLPDYDKGSQPCAFINRPTNTAQKRSKNSAANLMGQR